LSLAEWNFKGILKERLISLLEQQKIYWRQRGAIKWVKFGDAPTSFFHANATIRHRGNLITELDTVNGETLTSHSDKEFLLWNEYKERLGTSDFSGFNCNPSVFLERNEGLSFLESPFSNDEIDAVIKELPNDKSPGPDGFTNEFLKRCWPVIKGDFYNLVNAFYHNDLCLQSINSAYITLVPKGEGARKVNDFRPISLLNSSVKLVTKLLANRLQPLITKLIHANQYGFIKSRTI